jgi:hypothetical protein
MDTPDLPLRDIHLPTPVSWWPLAPGWWFCMGMAVLALAAAWWWWQGAAARRTRRAALAELARIEQDFAQDGDGHACAQALSRLLRRVALLAGHAEAAHCHGADLERLLASLSKAPAPLEALAVLGDAPYSPRAAAAIDSARFRDATASLRPWLIRLHPPRGRQNDPTHAAV